MYVVHCSLDGFVSIYSNYGKKVTSIMWA